MNFIEQLDPELRVMVEKLPIDRPLDLNEIPAARVKMKKMVIAMLAVLPAVEGVTSQDQFAPGLQGDPAVRVRVYRPNDQPSKLPALFWIHGGGYVMGDIEQDDRLMKQLVKRIGCVAVSVDYRLAPEHPFPAPVEDCYTGLMWLFAHANQLGVEPSRIAIGGASGGGGLAAGLALLARDRGEVQVAFQLLIYPMIDDRNVTPASYAITDPRMWNRESNRLGWKAYLGRDGGGAEVPPYAAAARATDLANLPPAYIPVGALDLFVDENIEYAQRLIQAGVPTELHVYPGAFHGFDLFAPSASVSKQFNADRDSALKRSLHDNQNKRELLPDQASDRGNTSPRLGYTYLLAILLGPSIHPEFRNSTQRPAKCGGWLAARGSLTAPTFGRPATLPHRRKFAC
jgi:acetyl esterase/lipase